MIVILNPNSINLFDFYLCHRWTPHFILQEKFTLLFIIITHYIHIKSKFYKFIRFFMYKYRIAHLHQRWTPYFMLREYVYYNIHIKSKLYKFARFSRTSIRLHTSIIDGPPTWCCKSNSHCNRLLQNMISVSNLNSISYSIFYIQVYDHIPLP